VRPELSFSRRHFRMPVFYHFAFFGLVPTFLLMTLITAVAFLLAVRLNAIAVAILAWLAVFSHQSAFNRQDNPLGFSL